MRILIVEDEVSINEAIAEILKREGFLSDSCFDGEDAYHYIMSNIYDAIILDIMLPNMDGFKVIETIRKNGNNAKIICLSALSNVDSKVKALSLGADDYLQKPFSPNELVARVKALLRRPNIVTESLLTYQDLEYDYSKKILRCKDQEVVLTSTEANIFYELILHPQVLCNKDQLFLKTWGFDSESDNNSIEVYMSFIRKKLRLIGSETVIKTIRSEGYFLL